MRALLDDVAVVHHDDAVGLFDGGQAVGNDDAGAAVHQTLQGLLDEAFGFVVKRAGGFVQEQYRGVFQDGAGDGYALALASRELVTVGADGLVQALR